MVLVIMINKIIKLHATYLLPKYAVTWNSSDLTLFLASDIYYSHGLELPIKNKDIVMIQLT